MSMYLVEATVTGITPAVAYAAADQIGAVVPFNLNGIVQPGGRFGIRQVVVVDASDTLAAHDLVLFDRSVTVATDNAASSTSDTDALFSQGVMSIVAANIVDVGPGRVATLIPGNGGYHCAATAPGGDGILYGVLIARAAMTPAAATDIRIKLYIEA